MNELTKQVETLSTKVDAVCSSVEKFGAALVAHKQKDQEYQTTLMNKLTTMEANILAATRASEGAKKDSKRALVAVGKYSVFGMIGGFIAQFIHYLVRGLRSQTDSFVFRDKPQSWNN